MGEQHAYDRRLARSLVLDELFDLTLYRTVRVFAAPEPRSILDDLIPVEERHVAFWKKFFDLGGDITLNLGRRFKLAATVLFCRIGGVPAIHLILEAVEIYGIRKYLHVWEHYRDTALGVAIRDVLKDEFEHEDEIVNRTIEQRIHPERVRNIFLGFNDGLVEILGAVSGFFAAFQSSPSVLVASFTVAIAGSISMAAGAYVAIGSEKEVERAEDAKKRFLGTASHFDEGIAPLKAAISVGISYFMGAMIPVLPVMFGATSVLISVVAGIIILIAVSSVLAFLSGMDVGKRIATNLFIIAFAVGITYVIGILAKNLWGVSI